jgi:hypothetical protein
MEPYIGSSYDVVRGIPHTHFVETDVPYDRLEWWRVGRLLGITGQPSSSSQDTTATFTYDYEEWGSLLGVDAWLRVKAFKDGESVGAGYWVKHWANLEKKATVGLVITQVPEAGGDYELQYTYTVPNSNYAITEVTMSVDGVEVASEIFPQGAAEAAVGVGGSIALAAGIAVMTGGVGWVVGAGVGGGVAATHYWAEFREEWMVRGSVDGFVECSDDLQRLLTGETSDSGYFYDNFCEVQHHAGPATDSDPEPTDAYGWYNMTGVPTNHPITVYGLSGAVCQHNHNNGDPNPNNWPFMWVDYKQGTQSVAPLPTVRRKVWGVLRGGAGADPPYVTADAVEMPVKNWAPPLPKH